MKKIKENSCCHCIESRKTLKRLYDQSNDVFFFATEKGEKRRVMKFMISMILKIQEKKS